LKFVVIVTFRVIGVNPTRIIRREPDSKFTYAGRREQARDLFGRLVLMVEREQQTPVPDDKTRVKAQGLAPTGIRFRC